MNRIVFFLLYFSEGAPIGFIWWAMPALLETRGFSVTDIATISAIAAVPWSFKFVFAPFVDLISMHLLRIKHQLLIYQVLMGVAIWFLPQAINSQSVQTILLALCFHGVFAALQDICIDALAIRSVPKEEVGKINGIMQAGMLVGRSVFGGAGVYIAHALGLNALVYFLIGAVWISLFVLQRTDFSKAEVKSVSVWQYILDFWRLLKGPGFWLLIFITYFAGFSYNGMSTITSAMLSKFGATPLEHTLTYSLLLPIAMTLGALIGGYLSDAKAGARVLQINLAFSVVTSMAVGYLFDHFPGLFVLIPSYVVFYFFIGATTASLYGFLMKHTSREFAALEFSIFMAVVNMCDSSTSYLTGQLVEKHSYFVSSAMIGLICSATLVFLAVFQRRKIGARHV